VNENHELAALIIREELAGLELKDGGILEYLEKVPSIKFIWVWLTLRDKVVDRLKLVYCSPL